MQGGARSSSAQQWLSQSTLIRRYFHAGVAWSDM
jgi:hypothetical protein